MQTESSGDSPCPFLISILGSQCRFIGTQLGLQGFLDSGFRRIRTGGLFTRCAKPRVICLPSNSLFHCLFHRPKSFVASLNDRAGYGARLSLTVPALNYQRSFRCHKKFRCRLCVFYGLLHPFNPGLCVCIRDDRSDLSKQ